MKFTLSDSRFFFDRTKSLEFRKLEMIAFFYMTFLFLITWVFCLLFWRFWGGVIPAIESKEWFVFISYLCPPLFLLGASYVAIVAQDKFFQLSRVTRTFILLGTMLIFALVISFFSAITYQICSPSFFLDFCIVSFIYCIVSRLLKDVQSRMGFYLFFTILFLAVCSIDIWLNHNMWVYLIFDTILGGSFIYGLGNAIEGLKAHVIKTNGYKATTRDAKRVSVYFYLESIGGLGVLISELF